MRNSFLAAIALLGVAATVSPSRAQTRDSLEIAPDFVADLLGAMYLADKSCGLRFNQFPLMRFPGCRRGQSVPPSPRAA